MCDATTSCEYEELMRKGRWCWRWREEDEKSDPWKGFSRKYRIYMIREERSVWSLLNLILRNSWILCFWSALCGNACIIAIIYFVLWTFSSPGRFFPRDFSGVALLNSVSLGTSEHVGTSGKCLCGSLSKWKLCLSCLDSGCPCRLLSQVERPGVSLAG